MYKPQPPNINPELWRRFLIKKRYNGTIKPKYDCSITIYHTTFGIIEFHNGRLGKIEGIIDFSDIDTKELKNYMV